MKYKTGTFPAFCATALAGNTAYTEPAEIFMGAVPGVVISSDATATPSPIALKREVSLMRVRLNVKDKEGNTNNENTAKGVDFTQDASIMIYRLPDYLKVMLLIYCLSRMVKSLKRLSPYPVIILEERF